MTPPDLTHAAAWSANRFLSACAPEEAQAAAPFVEQLFTALQNGHSFVWLNDAEVVQLKKLPLLVGNSGETPLVLAGRRLFLGRMWQLERDLALEIKRLAQAEIPPVDWMLTAQYLSDWFAETGSEGQRDAAALALLQPFMLITGGPGTGKTTTVAKLLGLICTNETRLPRIALSAPTGKAAAHMARSLHRALEGFDLSESVRQHLMQLEGQTVHRLLKLRPPQMQTAFNRQNTLPVDVLIVDEASMLDASLLLQLLRALRSGCRVIFLGDADQLPSVGIGAVLSALSQPTVLSREIQTRLAEYLPQHGFPVADSPPPLSANVANLTVSHRFGADSGIGCLARAVVGGKAQEAWMQFARFPDDLKVMEGSLHEQAKLLYRKHEKYWRAVDSDNVALAFAHVADVVVLTAWRQDAENFNAAYLRYLQQQQRAGADGGWFAGQIVMITRNDYVLDVFNGDIGIVMRDETNGLAAFFPVSDGFKKTPLSRLPAFEAAFAMTVHKSQGSEYREVWLLPPSTKAAESSDDVLSGLNNALLYTGITRARERFVFWGDRNQWQQAVETAKKRQSALSDFIKTLF